MNVLVLSTLLAVAALGADVPRLPMKVTPIEELDVGGRLRHTEILRVRRDFGRPNISVVLDAWLTVDEPQRIHDVRVWWSDEIDRFPFNDRVRRRLAIDYRRVKPNRWRVSIAADGRRFAFDVKMHRGRPAVFADVISPEGRTIRNCRADTASLYARRVLGMPVGLQAMIVTCTTPDGTVHRAPVRTTAMR